MQFSLSQLVHFTTITRSHDDLFHSLSLSLSLSLARIYAGSSRGRGSRGGHLGRGRGTVYKAASTRQLQPVQKQNNPFLTTTTSTGQSQNNNQNPFLGGGKIATTISTSSQQSQAQLAPPISSAQTALVNPFLVDRSTTNSQPLPPPLPPPPPSYASIVSGGGVASVRPPLGPVPTFITHGPGSVQVQVPSTVSNSSDVSSTQKVTNQFTNAPSQPDTAFNSTSSGFSILGQPKLQIPVTMGAPIFPSQAAAAAGNLLSYSQATDFQPGLQMQTTLEAPLGIGVGSLPTNLTLHVKGVPDKLNNESFMEKHFSRFGPLKAIECNPQKKYATVTFQDKVTIV